ncbi:MAG: hypothetical protein LBS57_04680 [Treponema sp.]|jgi:uncharacterized protein (DUF4415 family)|nr:hypothetical protein [Treponema sp.]
MAQTAIILKAGQKPAKDELKRAKREYREAQKASRVYDPGLPPSTPETLVEFAAMARELWKNRRNPARVVALRFMPDALAKYKSLGKGCTGIMADVLNYVADNPEILTKVRT